MAAPTAPPELESDGVNPIIIVAGTLLTVFLVTFVIYTLGGYQAQDAAGGTANLAAGPTGGGACGQGTPADSSYSVDLVASPDPPRPEGTTLLLTPRHEGNPVAGAKVCVTADMPEMQHPSLNATAKEVSGGRYETRIQFGMGGTWRTWVTIAEPDKPVVAVQSTIQVAQLSPD